MGFPGQVEISHPSPVSIEDNQGQHWTIADITEDDPQIAPVKASVGQYDMLSFMRELDQAQRLNIQIPLSDHETRRLVIPQSMVREWLSLKDFQD